MILTLGFPISLCNQELLFFFLYFQASFVLVNAIGFKNAWRLFWNYPATLLTPTFSFWTLGPIQTNSTFTWKKGFGFQTDSSKVGVSFFYTFINIIITFCGTLCCYFTAFINYGYLRIDKCIEIGSWYGDCTNFANGISIIFPLLISSFFIILLLKLKGEIEICNVPLTMVENFEICELQPTNSNTNTNNRPMKNIHSIVARVNSILQI